MTTAFAWRTLLTCCENHVDVSTTSLSGLRTIETTLGALLLVVFLTAIAESASSPGGLGPGRAARVTLGLVLVFLPAATLLLASMVVSGPE